MLSRLFVTAAFLMVAACSQVTHEEHSTIVVDGNSLPLITQTVQSAGQEIELTYVVVGNDRRLCAPDSPGDCEAQARVTRTGGPKS